jgi:hypothetical protein
VLTLRGDARIANQHGLSASHLQRQNTQARTLRINRDQSSILKFGSHLPQGPTYLPITLRLNRYARIWITVGLSP